MGVSWAEGKQKKKTEKNIVNALESVRSHSHAFRFDQTKNRKPKKNHSNRFKFFSVFSAFSLTCIYRMHLLLRCMVQNDMIRTVTRSTAVYVQIQYKCNATALKWILRSLIEAQQSVDDKMYTDDSNVYCIDMHRGEKWVHVQRKIIWRQTNQHSHTHTVQCTVHTHIRSYTYDQTSTNEKRRTDGTATASSEKQDISIVPTVFYTHIFLFMCAELSAAHTQTALFENRV